MVLEDKIRVAAQEADLYESTVHALLTFAALITHDGEFTRPDAHFGFGRRMDRIESGNSTDDGDGVEEGTASSVTPDLVAQKSETYGIVAEAKAGLAQGDDVWDAYVSQLSAYDCDMEGWWTDMETISHSNALLLMHRSRSRQLVSYLERAVEAGDAALSENAAVVEFVRSGQVDAFYSFSIEWGNVADPQLSTQLSDVIDVPLNKVLGEFAAIQFYDAPPPTPMLMAFLWGEFFGRLDELEFDEQTKTWPLAISVSAVTEELQRAYGSQALKRDERSCEFPKERWVREAMQQFVRLGLATAGEEPGSYVVSLRAFEGDLRSEMVRRLHNLRSDGGAEAATTVSEDQTTLPLDDL